MDTHQTLTRHRGRAILVAALACAACVGCTASPGTDAERDATLYNESSGSIVSYRVNEPGADKHLERTTPAGGLVAITLGGDCETGWWVERGGFDPVELDELCPGDEVTATDDGVRQSGMVPTRA